ncbi:hypothetical protein HSACCH_01285 [Halanaerobium saccharolyticum subsp. saccharolyticum DSM 6643]|uniref:DUF7305 domain-containing protein n=1 Tax=Halanaerobium saccharolyticum subsp. saccharolyticum DSM 6643 TaxID=1293054 RepID=M5EE80_9FIRM|nr:hypothetical protein [Halanaerobium saccharolyticum]CCU79377.1 hypothetical protein HSACCH_01285 [Halanaerobium saccharolyticum subsp. saccharolyticum DSM 6643]
MLKKPFKSIGENGYFLVTTFVVLAVLLVFGSVILRITLAEYKQAERDKNQIKAYYLARAGADLTAEAMLEKGDLTLGEVDFNIVKNNDKVSNIKVESSTSGFKINSTSEVNSVSEKVILNIDKISIFDLAVYMKIGGKLETFGSIIGDVGTGGTNEDLIIEEADVDGNIAYEVEKTLPDVDEFGFPDEPINYNDAIVFDTNKIYTSSDLNSDGIIAVKNIDIQNETLEFSVENEDIHVYVENEVKLGNDSEIKINSTGTGRLIIHTNYFKSEENAIISPELENSSYDPSKFYIMEKNNAEALSSELPIDKDEIEYKIETSSAFYGYIYAPNLDIQFETQGLSEGAIISNTLKLENGGTEIKYSPIDSPNDNFSIYARGKWE